jgi:hypothetical protein
MIDLTTLRGLLERAKKEPPGYSAHTALTLWLYANAGALLSAAEAAQSARAEIKSLTWKPRSSAPCEWKADTIVGRYDVGRGRSGYMAVRRSIVEGHSRDAVIVSCVTAGEAKKAAEADYQRLASSAIRALGKETGE